MSRHAIIEGDLERKMKMVPQIKKRNKVHSRFKIRQYKRPCISDHTLKINGLTYKPKNAETSDS